MRRSTGNRYLRAFRSSTVRCGFCSMPPCRNSFVRNRLCTGRRARKPYRNNPERWTCRAFREALPNHLRPPRCRWHIRRRGNWSAGCSLFRRSDRCGRRRSPWVKRRRTSFSERNARGCSSRRFSSSFRTVRCRDSSVLWSTYPIFCRCRRHRSFCTAPTDLHSLL